MKGIFKNKKLIFVSIATVLMIVAAVGAFLLQGKDKDVDMNDAKYSFAFYEGETAILDNHHDIGVMIADCDDVSDFITLTNGTVTHRKGRYVQGTGAIVIGDREDSTANVMLNLATFNEVDISAYADKTIHMSLYVNKPKQLGNEIVFELTSSGKSDADEIQWKIPATTLKTGWNELYLAIEDASVIGTPDFAKMNFYRIFSLGVKPGVRIAYDCIYATDTEGMSLEAVKGEVETASTKKGYLVDLDELKGLSSTGKLQSVQAEGEVKEGAGAVAITNLGLVWLQANLKPFDLTPYQDGKITFWLYANDSSYIKNNITVELSSSGTFDKNEISWDIKNTDLKSGWNEVELFVCDAKASSKEPVDLSKINYLRVWSKEPAEQLIVIFDAFRATELSKRVPSDGMILNCDTEEALRITADNKVSLTVAADEHKQGTGALKSVGKGVVWYNILFEELVDVSKYKDGGLHVWLYISDKTKLDAPVNIELSSGGKCDVDEYQWQVQGLKNGWNELKLSFKDANVKGTPDLSSINFMRVFCTKVTEEITAIIDDVRAMHIEEKTPEPGVILDCDDFGGVKVTSESKLDIAYEEGEYKVGAGAYKSEGAGQVRYKAVLAKPVDISAYKDGALQMWLYIGDKSAFSSTSITIEISSSGRSDNSEIQWTYAIDDLKENSWNQLTLPFKEGTKVDGSTGKIDFKTINHFRMFLNKKETSADALLILDDVRAVEWQEEEETVEPGLILSGDDKKNIKSASGFTQTTTEGEYKVGTGAFKSTGTAQVRYRAVLKNAVDLSAYKDGALQFWLYVGDISAFNCGSFVVELSSGGSDTAERIRWKNQNFADLTENSWNLITLPFADIDSSKSVGEIDFTQVDFFRLYVNAASTKEDAVMILDDVRAIEVENTDKPNDPVEPDEPNELGMIMSGDTLKNIKTAVGFEKIITNVKVGTGAFKSEGKELIRYQAILNNAVDISTYKDGALQFWLYVGDTDEIQNESMTIELGSAGEPDKQELQWSYAVSKLTANAWNQITLKFADGAPKGAEAINFATINHFRIHMASGKNALLILDDVRAVEMNGLGEILSCNSLWNVSSSSGFTVTNDNKKVGVGAYASTGNAQVRFRTVLTNAVDISDYKDGALQFWLYVGDITKTTDYDVFGGYQNFAVELSSAGTDTANRIRWSTSFSALNIQANSWNKITLKFADAASYNGEMDYSKVNFFRLFMGGETSADALMIVDDVRAVEMNGPGEILSCNSLENISSSSGFTVTNDNKKVGTGAYASTGTAQVRYRATLTGTVDISAYKKGALQFWLYVGDITKTTDYDVFGGYQNFAVELSSSGTDTANRIRWSTSFSALNIQANSWNKITLKFADAAPYNGEMDYSKVNFFRLFMGGGTSADALMIVDDVRAVDQSIIFDFDTLSIPTSSNMDFASITTQSTECKVGTGAFKSKVATTDTRLFAARLSKPIDLSAYKDDGGIQFWLYIGERAKLISSGKEELKIELTSSAKADQEELEWSYKIADLNENAWNLITLRFSDAKKSTTAINYQEVDFMRIHLNGGLPSQGAVAILDDVRAVHIKQIQACDDATGLTLGSLTTDANYRKSNGAYLSESGVERIKTAFANTNIKNYTDGYLRVWVYLENDTTNWNAPLSIELTSSGKPDVEETQWNVEKGNLKAGWNEVHLPFKSGTIQGISLNTSRGPANYSAVNFMRIFSNPAFTGKISVDDIIVTTY